MNQPGFAEQLHTRARTNDRRRVPRYPFVAAAEIIEANQQTMIQVRISELSWYGCYIETANPVAEGVNVHIKIFKDSDLFESAGKVVYSHRDVGFGLAFHEVRPQHKTTLRKWLLEAMRGATKIDRG